MEPKNMAIGMFFLAVIAVMCVLTVAIGVIVGADVELLLGAMKDIILVIVGGIAGALTTNRYFTEEK